MSIICHSERINYLSSNIKVQLVLFPLIRGDLADQTKYVFRVLFESPWMNEHDTPFEMITNPRVSVKLILRYRGKIVCKI